MAKHRLEEIRIRPSKNGGHNVRHDYSAKPRLAKGSLSGGMMMDRPPSEEFNFGPKDASSLMKHIAGALALKGAAPQSAGSPGEEEPLAAE